MGDNVLDFGTNSYWRKKDGGNYDGPFCMRCADKLQQAIRLNRLDEKGDTYECPDCHNRYGMVAPPSK